MKDRNTSKHLCLCFGLLPMLNIYQFIFYNFLRLRFQRVHQPPAHGVTGFQFLGDARRIHTGDEKPASNANIYMFCDFGRIAPAKMLVEG